MGGDCLRSLFAQLSQTEKEKLLENTGYTNVTDLVARIPKEYYFNIANEFIENCKKENINMFLSREFDDKLDYGDIDIYYSGSVDIIAIIKKVFNPLVLSSNGNVVTFSYKLSNTQYFQVDFISTETPLNAQFFFSYGDIGMVMGMIAHHNKLKYTDNSLCLKINGLEMNKLSNSSLFNEKEEHLFELTKDPLTIANFFTLSYDRWCEGFSTMIEAYEWLRQSIFYNPRHFVHNEEKLKRHDKPKRKFMAGFENYSKNILESYVQKEHINIIEYTFNFFEKNKIIHEISTIANKRKTDLDRALKFSGKDLIEKGITGKEIGVGIKNFQNYISDKYEIEFYKWLDNSSNEHVKDVFETFYNENYKKYV